MEIETLDEFGTRTNSNKRIVKCVDSNDSDLVERSDKADIENKVSRDYKQWSLCGPSAYMAIGNTIKILKSRVFELKSTERGILFSEKNISVDDLIQFVDSKSDKILTEIQEFWTKGDIFKQFGFLHRRGYLFYGPAGSGKTSLVQQIIVKIIKNGGLVFLCSNPGTLSEGLSVFRQIEPHRPVVCIFEDIDAIISTYGEAQLLSVLDGENQIDNVLNIATTNYPELLDKRIVSRPRRFDRVIKIGMPSKSVRTEYFSKKLGIPESDSEIKKWVSVSKHFSFAAMAELVISVKCLGNSFEQSVEMLKKLMVSKPKSSEFDSDGYTLGFGGKPDADSDDIESEEL